VVAGLALDSGERGHGFKQRVDVGLLAGCAAAGALAAPGR
jgi:hypothetical protein